MNLMTWRRASAVLSLFVAASARGGELRTYSFVGEAPAYNFSCGECSGPSWFRGQVEGGFTVSLDFENGDGTLWSLSAMLKNMEGNYGPGLWQPIDWTGDFFDPNSLHDRYRPPHNGVLAPAAFRPLGPGTLTEAHWAPYTGANWANVPVEAAWWLNLGVGFEPAPANAWTLYFDGAVPSPDGLSVRHGSSFMIYFEGDSAKFSYFLPFAADAVPSITAADAELIPEPGAVVLGVVGLGWLGVRRRRLTRRKHA